jgi:hypothetical protein
VAAVVPAYFDSALVAKFYLNEPGREQVRTLARRSGLIVSSGIAVAEVSRASTRRKGPRRPDTVSTARDLWVFTFKAVPRPPPSASWKICCSSAAPSGAVRKQRHQSRQLIRSVWHGVPSAI